jgi:CRISPR-associated endonuclease/helicase Cas3
LAKSTRGGKHSRPHFRHELASALALLHMGASDLTVYLAACHHGKVRLSIRALPGEKKPDAPDKKYARGIWEGDFLPAADLGDGLVIPEMPLDLEPMLLGAGANGTRSWLEKMIGLRDRMGVFRLAYLESLIRAADVYASAYPQEVLQCVAR